MSIQPDVLTYEQFVVYVRSALHYLYDPVNLRRSPLIELLGLTGEFDQAAALQGALVAAMRALKPADAEPPQSRAWRIYDMLSFQYMRQLPRETVANQLGISDRQLRREQRVAIEALAQQLWQSPQMESSLHSGGRLAPSDRLPAGQEPGGLDAFMPEPRVAFGEALENVRSLVNPLARQAGVSVQIYITADLVDLPLSPMPLRTILLTVLTVAIPLAGGASVLLRAGRRADEIAVEVTCSDPALQNPITEKDLAALATVQEQAAFYTARLVIADPTAGRFAVTLLLPAPSQPIVLIVDDNSDWLDLAQRYAIGAQYQVVTTRAPETACDSASKLQPSLILLDVMMHLVDGWQVLSDLRHNPATAHIPVVVCTILPLEEMALTLGADAFLQKPVSQEQFLRLLNRQCG